MAVQRKNTSTKSAEKLTVASRLGQVFLNAVSPKKNSNGKDYIATPHGAVYARIDEVEPGLHTVVKLSNDALALNRPTDEERLAFINSQMEKFPNMTARDIADYYGL